MKFRFFPSYSSIKKRFPRILLGLVLMLVFALQAGSFISIQRVAQRNHLLWDAQSFSELAGECFQQVRLVEFLAHHDIDPVMSFAADAARLIRGKAQVPALYPIPQSLQNFFFRGWFALRIGGRHPSSAPPCPAA